MSRPNVVLIVMDTARARDAAPAHTDAALPAIDRLAEEGIEYTQTFASAPWTLPSHAGLFTGTYSSKHGAHAGHKHLDEGLPTLAECFAGAGGYETVAASNNTWISEEFGFARGFDTLYKTWQYVQTDTDLGEVARTEQGIEMVRALAARLADGNPAVNLANAVYGKFFRKRADDGAQRTNEWVEDWLAERDPTTPFFLFVNYLEPHLDYHPPKAHAERHLPAGVSFEEAMDVSQDAWGYIASEVDLTEDDFEVLRALYRAEIAYLDERIGELRKHIETAGEWEDTVFVLTSDHGENVGEHGLMDHQYSLHNTLLHVPLVVTGGAFDSGDRMEDPVQLVDLPPTLLDAADIDAPAARTSFQGISFHPESDAEPRERIIAEYMAPQPSMDALERRVGNFPPEVRRYDRSLRAIRADGWKLIRGSDGTRELYGPDDTDEQDDRAAENDARVSALEDDLDGWLDSFEHAETTGEASMSASAKARLEDLGYIQ